MIEEENSEDKKIALGGFSEQKPDADKRAEETSDEEAAEANASTSFDVIVLQESDGSEPFTRWLNALRDRVAKQRILARIAVVRRGSLGTTRPVGEGVAELKIDYGRGYRLYFGRKGNKLVVLILGGDKDSQAADIARAKDLWRRYKDEIENV